ncbi:glycosyltransferase family 2 protein [Thalassobius sp. S69A]|uniref:glycosyltransferase family 2 protein n=1 Tax=unclassified Thalassovita TaxID=2619711 RepID=UPI000C467892|nr:glucosyl transferase [Paracoccaceae bacterium]
MPRFSIIIPAYNAANTIGDTLSAIVAQTYTDWEALVIDDGSVDATREIVGQWTRNDTRIRLAGHPGDGPSDARNFAAFHLAQGDILAFCDADDMWANTKLTQIAQAMVSPLVDGTFGRVAFFAQNPADARSLSNMPKTALSIPILMGENPVCTLSNLSIRREIFLLSGGFDRSFVHNEDLDWLIRAVGSGASLRGIDEVQVWYRASPTGLSSDLPAMRASRLRVLQTAQRYGYRPDSATEAIYLRYLARRALRLDLGRLEALRLSLDGLRQSPRAFCSPARRGIATALAAALAPVLPRALRRALFSH